MYYEKSNLSISAMLMSVIDGTSNTSSVSSVGTANNAVVTQTGNQTILIS
jgi:hypothetical protein